MVCSYHKILLQKLWEEGIGWDAQVPAHIKDEWLRWRSELHKLASKHISRCYFQTDSPTTSVQLHGFADASEVAYAAVVYIRYIDMSNDVRVSLVMAKTKVAPIKLLSIRQLELCGARLLAQLLQHIRLILDVPLCDIYAWTDSTIVVNWLDGNPKRFKTYVGNRISNILDLIPSDKWRHVRGSENPADCASRGLYPSELLQHSLWWDGPRWLEQSSSDWPIQGSLQPNASTDEEKEIVLLRSLISLNPFMDCYGVLRVGGRQQLSQRAYQLIQTSKHSSWNGSHELLHAGTTLVTTSLSRRYHIGGARKTIRSIIRECMICRKFAVRSRPQMTGQLPVERITPDTVFDNVGVDYAGPVYIKYGYVRKPTVVKAYICVFVSLSVKAVHLELVTDLTSEAFIACLRRFVSRRGLPKLIWSDNGTNFVGACRQIKELYTFLESCQRLSDKAARRVEVYSPAHPTLLRTLGGCRKKRKNPPKENSR